MMVDVSLLTLSRVLHQRRGHSFTACSQSTVAMTHRLSPVEHCLRLDPEHAPVYGKLNLLISPETSKHFAPAPKRPLGLPTTLGNMREQGARPTCPRSTAKPFASDGPAETKIGEIEWSCSDCGERWHLLPVRHQASGGQLRSVSASMDAS